MSIEEQKRMKFVAELKQFTDQGWAIVREANVSILKIILSHNGNELDKYIAIFKVMLRNMINNVRVEPDKYSNDPPANGQCTTSFIGAQRTTRNYALNYSLRLYFIKSEKKIYKFEVLRG